MFTPPTSPLPSPRAKLEEVNPMEEMQHQAHVTLPPPQGSMSPLHPKSFEYGRDTSQQQYREHEYQQSSDVKRRIGRQIKWTAFAIPVVLILITLSKHYSVELLSMTWVNDQQTEEHQNTHWQDHTLNMEIDESYSSHLLHHHVFQLAGSRKDEMTSEKVFRRQETTDVSVSIATGTATATELATPTSTAAVSASDSATATTTVPATAQTLPTIPTSTPVLPIPFPQPWDSSITQNFSSQSCYNFFLNMTNSQDFRSCRPFGLLQNTSDDFADFQTNLTALNAVIWGTCNPTPGIDQCALNMAKFASSLQSACAEDLTDNNLFAVSTQQALNAYSLTQNTGCLNDPSTDSYCYVKAVHNTNPSDLYFYSLISGVAISNSTTLTCSSCTKSLMSLYVNALNANGSQLTELASVYGAAQALAASACGTSYAEVSTSTQADSSNGASSIRRKVYRICLTSLMLTFLFSL
ncbi:hypothetical protein F5890DRAFT_1474189 [Lentinula detonsa]|uniref:DUF7729 domain-containing protein n=1 Tax=Lentinula detonsa TaxID=2804962 RepID=A0AA38Q007_9AGAR|nr:hypothetical protein F5890DRAFT_1474189 [Lentinula detonsa]